MKNFLKVIIIVVIGGLLTACMGTNNDGNQSEPNEQNETNDKQTEDEFDQDNPKKERDYDRNKDDQDRNNQKGYNRSKNRDHHKGHHERREGTPNDSRSSNENNQEEIVLENEAFQIFDPAPKARVKNKIVVRGLARVFEGTIQYEFEDNHSTLDEGNTTASKTAPDWGEFEITIEVDKSAHRSARIILYEESEKDGSKMNELIIPVHLKR